MKITLTVALMLINLLGYSQTTLQKNTDLRFRGKVVGYPSEKDEVGLMKNFTLDIQWWMFLGEPMEFYGFEWTANDHFFIDGSKIARTQLIKYPDLLKRFDILKPSKMTLELVGGGEAKMGLNEVFVYRIPDYKVLYFKAGVSSENLSPDSPETWYQFWKWGDEATDINFQYKHIDAIYQNSENTFNNLTEEAKKAIIKTYKAKFKEASSIIITDLKAHLEWPTQELKSIAKLYKEYESGEKQASPLEEIEKAEKKIAKETTYTKDDFWGDVADTEKPIVEVEIYDAGVSNGRWQGEGLREKNSKKVLIEPLFTLDPLVDQNSYDVDSDEILNYYKQVSLDNGNPKTNLVNIKGEIVVHDYHSSGSIVINEEVRADCFEGYEHLKYCKILAAVKLENKPIIWFLLNNENNIPYHGTFDIYYLENFELIKKGISIRLHN